MCLKIIKLMTLMAEWLAGKQKPLTTVSLSMHDIVFIKKRKGILMQI